MNERINQLRAEIEELKKESAWVASGCDYDHGIHHNPDAKAWADLFVATFPRLADKHDLMLGWFANAMMAMHDFLVQRDNSELEALRELLRDSCEAIRHGGFSTGICCCGSSVDSHGFGDGHSPVDEGDYYASGLIERIDSALKPNQ